MALYKRWSLANAALAVQFAQAVDVALGYPRCECNTSTHYGRGSAKCLRRADTNVATCRLVTHRHRNLLSYTAPGQPTVILYEVDGVVSRLDGRQVTVSGVPVTISTAGALNIPIDFSQQSILPLVADRPYPLAAP